MADVFFSYSRRDEDFVRMLAGALEERGKDVWRDKDDIPPAVAWEDEIRRGIDASDVFAFVLSPDSVASAHCRDELEHALARNKAIVPLVRRDPNGAGVPEELARLNYVFARDGDDFEAALDALLATLDGLPEHTRLHTRVLARAAEWDADSRDFGRLLSGRELRDADEWLAAAAGKEPPPTALHHEYVLASRKRASRRQRVLVAFALTAAALTAALAVAALLQRNEAQRQRDEAVRQARIATSRALAAQSATALGARADVAALLALEAYESARTFEARDALVAAVQRTERLDWIVPVTATAVTVSPDGRVLLTGRADGTVSLWDLSRRRPRGDPLRVSSAAVSRLVFAPDGRTFAALHDGDAPVSLWEAAARRRVGALGSAVDGDLAFSPDGRTAAVVSAAQTTLWDVRRREPLRRFPASGPVAFSPDGTKLASAEFLGPTTLDPVGVRFRDVRSGRQLGEPLELGAPLGSAPSSVAFSPDGRLLAAATSADDLGNPGALRVWELGSRRPLGRLLRTGRGGVTRVAFGGDGTTIVSAADRVRVWNVSGGSLFESAGDPFRAATGDSSALDVPGAASTFHFADVAIGRDGTVAALREDGSVSVSHLTRPWVLAERLAADAAAAALSADGAVLAAASSAGIVTLRRLRPPRSQPESFGTGSDASALALDGDGATVALGDWDAGITLWDAARRRPRGEPARAAGEVAVLAFAPQDDAVVAIDLEGRVRRLPLDGGRLEDLEGAGDASAIAFDPAGDALAVGHEDGSVALRESRGRRRLAQPFAAHDGPVAGLAFDPEGRTLATAGERDGEVRLWDVTARPRLRAAAKIADSGLSSVAFAADGRTLALGIRNLTFVLWDPAERRPVGRPLRTEDYGPVSLGFPNPDLSTWVSFGRDGGTLASRAGQVLLVWKPILWSRDDGLFRKRLCHLAGRNLTPAEWSTYLPGADYRRTCPEWPVGR